jgi:hypothetical protein
MVDEAPLVMTCCPSKYPVPTKRGALPLHTGLLFAEEFLFLQPSKRSCAGLPQPRASSNMAKLGCGTCQSDELELVALGGSSRWKLAMAASSDSSSIERATFLGNSTRDGVVDGLGEFARFLEVDPEVSHQNIRIRGIKAMARAMAALILLECGKAFDGALAGREFAVARVNVAGQKVGAVGIGARHDQRGDAHYIGCEPGCDEDSGLPRWSGPALCRRGGRTGR